MGGHGWQLRDAGFLLAGDGNALKLNCGDSYTTPRIYSRSLSCALKTGGEKMVSDERLLAFTRGLSTSWGYSQTPG